jgi:hypothetical protein
MIIWTKVWPFLLCVNISQTAKFLLSQLVSESAETSYSEVCKHMLRELLQTFSSDTFSTPSKEILMHTIVFLWVYRTQQVAYFLWLWTFSVLQCLLFCVFMCPVKWNQYNQTVSETLGQLYRIHCPDSGVIMNQWMGRGNHTWNADMQNEQGGLEPDQVNHSINQFKVR